MPTIAGMLSSIGPTCERCGSAPSWMARSKAAAASRTRNAMAHTDGPCAWANRCPKEPGSALTTKLMSPCECSVTFLLRCRATTGKPRRSNRLRSSWGSGAVYSTNSNPSVPIGFVSEIWAITGLRLKIDLVSIVTNGTSPETASREISAVPAFGPVKYRQFGDRGGLLPELRAFDSGMARHGRPGCQSRPVRRRSHGADGHGQGGGEPRGRRTAVRRPAAPHNRTFRPAAHASRADAVENASLCTGRSHGARIRTPPGGAALATRSRHTRSTRTRVARTRRGARTGARGLNPCVPHV